MSNEFKLFAGSVGANTLTPTAYAALTSILGLGFQTGTANSQQFNTLFRQCSTIAAVIGQYINDQGFNALDDGTVATTLTAFKNAVNANVPSLETSTTDSTFVSTSATKSASPQWSQGLVTKKSLGTSWSSPAASNGTWFTNSTGHPILLVVVANVGNASTSGGTVFVELTGINFGGVIGISNDASATGSFSVVVPAGSQWKVSWGSPVSSVVTTLLS